MLLLLRIFDHICQLLIAIPVGGNAFVRHATTLNIKVCTHVLIVPSNQPGWAGNTDVECFSLSLSLSLCAGRTSLGVSKPKFHEESKLLLMRERMLTSTPSNPFSLDACRQFVFSREEEEDYFKIHMEHACSKPKKNGVLYEGSSKAQASCSPAMNMKTCMVAQKARCLTTRVHLSLPEY